MSLRVNTDVLARVVEITLVVALLVLLLKFALSFLELNKMSIAPKPDVGGSVAASAQEPMVTSILKEFDMFHRAKPAVIVMPETTAPETSLNLKVFGMRADLRGESSSAIIQTPDMKQDIFYIGEDIIPGVSLSRVEIDYVLLDRNGVLERLSRQGHAEDGKKLSRLENIDIMEYKAIGMINDLRFYPHRQGRTVVGYKVAPRRGGSLEEYGFKRNDIILSINGVDLAQSRVNLPNLWKNLKIARYASIQILRNDVPKTIEVNLK